MNSNQTRKISKNNNNKKELLYNLQFNYFYYSSNREDIYK